MRLSPRGFTAASSTRESQAVRIERQLTADFQAPQRPTSLFDPAGEFGRRSPAAGWLLAHRIAEADNRGDPESGFQAHQLRQPGVAHDPTGLEVSAQAEGLRGDRQV